MRSTLFRYAKVFALTSMVVIALICLYTYIQAQTLPKFSQYWYFATLYGSGFLTTPIRGKLIVFVPLCIAIVGWFIGMAQMMYRKNLGGLVLCYLALIELVQLPYYMGRSMHQTIYSISLPFLLLSGALIEYGVFELRKNRMRLATWALVCVCAAVVVTPFARGSAILFDTAMNMRNISYDTHRYVLDAFTRWDIRTTAQYAFLSTHLPAGCPLLSFDEKEFELFPALGVPPAFQYAFVYGFITSKEQVDSLIPHRGATEICVFVSDKFVDQEDIFSYGMYKYFMQKFKTHLQVVASDTAHGHVLYTLPRGAFR